MIVKSYSANDYQGALHNLLPPGAAWDWPVGGLGDAMLLATSQELARVDAAIPGVLDAAIETHRPAVSRWHIEDYRRVGSAAIDGVSEAMPRQPFTVGAHVGERLWSAAAPLLTFPIPLLRIDHLVGPLRVGSKAGDCLWGSRSRYILRVRYYRSVVNPKVVWDALKAFKQAHVYLWFEDITGVGGIVNYGQN